MDLSEYLKSSFQIFHKTQGADFGKSLNIEAKGQKLKERRRSNRNKLILEKRLINEKTMSPFVTPQIPNKRNANVFKQKTKLPNKTPNILNKQVMESTEQAQRVQRIEMLKKWQEEKLKKRQEEKIKQKPLFKVTRAPSAIGGTNLENVNKVIKGKPFKHIANMRTKSPVRKYNFAPENHQFQAPINIEPINTKKPRNKEIRKPLTRQQNVEEVQSKKKVKKVVICPENEYVTPKKITRVYKKTPAKVGNMKDLNNINNKENVQAHGNHSNHKTYELRSRSVTVSEVQKPIRKNLVETMKNPSTIQKVNIKSTTDTENEIKDKRKLKRQSNVKSISSVKSADMVKKNINCSSSELSIDYPLGEYADTSSNVSLSPSTPKHAITPNSRKEQLTYISPFVTISRGKNSARKEFHYRKSKGGMYDSSPDMKESTGPKAGAAYFRRLLDQEFSRIQGLCDEWTLYKETQSPPEESCDMINVTIGQSQLLLHKKFKQFRDLVNSCENDDSGLPVTCEDLHGYWDTAYIQVDNLNKRFENLMKMRDNNWEEIKPTKKKPVAKKTASSKPKVQSSQASSRLKEAIKAARNRAKVDQEICNKEETTDSTFNGGFFSIRSPKKSSRRSTPKHEIKTPGSKRKSLLVNVLVKESQKRLSSPGLAILKVSQKAKALECSTDSHITPGRSILKTRNAKSSKKKSKSVLFTEDNCTEDAADDNNEVPVGILISITPEEDGRRRSSTRRLTRSKLFP